jgi:hypothetical protein
MRAARVGGGTGFSRGDTIAALSVGKGKLINEMAFGD